ncbi:hypothetical protein BD626DRAFT_576408 [Schizophyllum amplum]|uniref:Uncharacterized protein n=1 Tax=Schizophyllum amplum TaxID=97359 RepID=A0A550BTM0_9AGAR|nr:hypothetical protein BD626DRAFT_576408 [Auriculariopsis ampla]
MHHDGDGVLNIVNCTHIVLKTLSLRGDSLVDQYPDRRPIYPSPSLWSVSAAISLLDERVVPLLTHINNQRHTIRELMDIVDQGLPLDRELKTRELRRQLKRAEEERDRAQATLLAAGGHIAADRENTFLRIPKSMPPYRRRKLFKLSSSMFSSSSMSRLSINALGR